MAVVPQMVDYTGNMELISNLGALVRGLYRNFGAYQRLGSNG